MEGERPPRGDPSVPTPDHDALLQWCRAAVGDRHAVEVADAGGLTGPDVDALLPGVLEEAEDPAALVGAVARAVGPGRQVHLAVTWAPTSPPAARRAFHPASLVGLLAEECAVVHVDVRDGLIGATVEREPSEAVRRRRAHKVVLELQGTMELYLDRWLTLRRRVVDLDDAVEGLERTLVATDRAEFAARRQRNTVRADLREAREELRAAREDLKAEGRRLRAMERRLAGVERERDAAWERTATLEERLRRWEAGRWHRLGVVLRRWRPRPRSRARRGGRR